METLLNLNLLKFVGKKCRPDVAYKSVAEFFPPSPDP